MKEDHRCALQLYADVNEEGEKVLSEASKSLAIGLETFNFKFEKLNEEDLFSYFD